MVSLAVQNFVDAKVLTIYYLRATRKPDNQKNTKVCLQFIILEQPENYNYMPRL